MQDNRNNSAVLSDILTINNALNSLIETRDLPIPEGNNNTFQRDGSYSHGFSDIDTFGIYGKITENTIAKGFLDITPLDPRTNQYYSYGITKSSKEYEIAGIISDKNGAVIAKVDGNYTAEEGPYNLIRSYNSPKFVINKGPNLPYNPDEKIFTVTDQYGKIYFKGDEITTNSNKSLELYFSDGSVSILEKNSTIVLSEADFPSDTNLVTHIKLFLKAGTIWTKASKLDPESYFEIHTSDVTAAVRGTIFGVNVDKAIDTEIVVLKGSIEILETNNNKTNKIQKNKSIALIKAGKSIKIKNNNLIKKYGRNKKSTRILQNKIPDFKKSGVKINQKLQKFSENTPACMIGTLEGNQEWDGKNTKCVVSVTSTGILNNYSGDLEVNIKFKTDDNIGYIIQIGAIQNGRFLQTNKSPTMGLGTFIRIQDKNKKNISKLKTNIYKYTFKNIINKNVKLGYGIYNNINILSIDLYKIEYFIIKKILD